jgi:hypothetical protein
MHIQRMMVVAGASVGLIATLLPWLNSAILEMFIGTGGWGYVTVALSSLALVIALLGDRKQPLKLWGLGITTVCGLGLLGAGVYLVVNIKKAVEGFGDGLGGALGDQVPGGGDMARGMGRMLSGGIDVGYGLYVLIAGGAILTVLPLLFRRKKA